MKINQALNLSFKNAAATKNINKLSDSLAKIDFTNTFSKLSESLNNINNILTKVENGEGTLGKFINNEDLYNNLSRSSKELEELLSDLKSIQVDMFSFPCLVKNKNPISQINKLKFDNYIHTKYNFYDSFNFLYLVL